MSSVGSFGNGQRKAAGDVPRTERDLSMPFVLGGITVLSLAILVWLTVAGAPGGVLYSSGLIAGSAVAGLLIAIPQGLGKERMIDLVHYLPAWFENNSLTALIMFGLLAATLYYVGRHGLSGGKERRS